MSDVPEPAHVRVAFAARDAIDNLFQQTVTRRQKRKHRRPGRMFKYTMLNINIRDIVGLGVQFFFFELGVQGGVYADAGIMQLCGYF